MTTRYRIAHRRARQRRQANTARPATPPRNHRAIDAGLADLRGIYRRVANPTVNWEAGIIGQWRPGERRLTTLAVVILCTAIVSAYAYAAWVLLT